MLRMIFVVSAVLICAEPVFAQDDMEERMELARESMVLSGAEAASLQMMEMIFPSMEPALRQQYPDATTQQVRQAMALVSDALSSKGPEIVEASARAYALRFTAEELAEMNAFYRTPTGMKMVALMPELMEEAGLAGQQIATRALIEIQPELNQIMQPDGFGETTAP